MTKPQNRKSKIVCTLGPAVSSYEKIIQLMEAGMDVARLNFSHGTHSEHAQNISWLRRASESCGRPIAIMADLQGPKIRTGQLMEKNGHISLSAGDEIYFKGADPSKMLPGDGSQDKPIYISYPHLIHDLKVKDPIYIEDALLCFEVVEKDTRKGILKATLRHGSKLGERKGVNMPASRLSTLGLTEKDWEDVLFAIQNDVDFLALSFVRTAREVKSLAEFLEKKGSSIHIVSKIEKREAIENIDEILLYSHALMVARGDLGVEIGNEKVPIVQKQLIRKARELAKPVITATQMLMSMVDNPTPSRAEASDVANANLDGSDAVMLSNETATGRYPLESVRTMSKIILGAEGLESSSFRDQRPSPIWANELKVSEAIEAAATQLSESLGARCLACLTRSGQAARLLAKGRPFRPIYAFAENAKVRSQLCLSWGVSVINWKEKHNQDYSTFDEMLAELAKRLCIEPGELAVMTAGIPTTLQVGTTNTVVVRCYDPQVGSAPL